MTIPSLKLPNWLPIIALIAIAGIIWLSIPTCRGVKKQAVAVDSTAIVQYKQDTAALHSRIRVTEGVASKEKHRADSLQKIVNAYDAKLDTKAKTINDLIAKVKKLQSASDTSAYADAVDELVDQVQEGIALVNQYRSKVDSLTKVLWTTIKADSASKSDLHQLSVECNNFAFKLQLDVQRLREDSAVLSNKLNKSKKVTRIAILVAAIEAAILVLQR